MSKKYRLLKDLPDAKSGEIYTKQKDNTNWYISPSNSCYHAATVEDNPDWFELINERIEVKYIESFMTEGPGRDCRFYTNGDVPKEKLPLIKQAIEKVLNDDSVFNAEKINAQLDKLKKLTQ